MTKISNQYSLTNILTADLANSRLGINNVSPAYSLDLTGTARVTTSAYFATTSGSVGIGTTSPNLSSFGTALTLVAASGYGGIEVYGFGSTNGGQIDFGSGSTRFAAISGEYESATNGYLNIRTLKAGAITNAVRVTSAGYVGIGTTTPDRPLDIYSSTVLGIARIRGNNSNGVALTIQNDQNAQAISIYAAGTSGFGLSGWAGNTVLESETGIVYSAYNGNHIFQTASRTERMRIHANGNVVIGSSTDNGNKLNVVGNISSNSTVSGSVGSFSTMNANAFKSFVGSTTIAAGATATIYTMDTMGLYTVQASYVGSSIIFCASAIFYAQIYSGNYVKCIDLYDGANIALFNSGSAIQVRNDGYGTYSFSWTILFQPAF
jgi:hypothetical protein